MMQGDQFSLPIRLINSDGSPIEPQYVTDIEISVGNVTKTLSNGDVEYSSSQKVFYVSLKQVETFSMDGNVPVQARILFLNGDVLGIDLGTINFKKSNSKAVLK